MNAAEKSLFSSFLNQSPINFEDSFMGGTRITIYMKDIRIVICNRSY